MPDVHATPHAATVLAADAVGYSRAMSRNEARAMRALAVSRTVIQAEIDRCGGRVFATAGDSVLAEFADAGQAVRAATAIQYSLAARAQDDEVLTYRIGVHAGLVHPHGTDLLGDTVNVAARLESLAWPGGICLSGQVAELVPDLPRSDLIELGPQVLKNILEPVRVLRFRMGEAQPIGTDATSARASTVAVLAFDAPPAEIEPYLAEGLADDLVMGLSRFQSLAVLGRASTSGIAAPDRDPMRLAAELGVTYLVRGALRALPGRLRISVELIDAETRRTLWAERFERPADDILAAQDEVVHRLVAALVGRIEGATIETMRRNRPESTQAFDLVLQGIHHANRLDRASNTQALDRFEAAVARDPNFGLAWAWLALMRLRRWAWTSSGADLGPVREAADRALALDPSESWCHLVAGQVAMYSGALETAEVHHKKAFSLNPYDCHILALRSPLATYLGKPEEGIAWATRAIALFPDHPAWYASNLGLAQYCAGRYAEAAATYAGVADPQIGVLGGLAAARARAGDAAGARAAAAVALAIEPGFSSAVFVGTRPFKHDEDRAHLLAGLRLAGLPQ